MFKARASKAGNLMIGGESFTKADADLLKEYRLREKGEFISSSGRKLGPISGMNEKIDALLQKKKAGFQFGKTALSFISEQWLADKYGYKTIMVTKETMKGQMCEQDSIELVQQVVGGPFRLKCKERKYDDHHTGICDIDLPTIDTVEDLKTSWDMMTFLKVEEPPELYFAQGQVYMRLYKRSKFVLRYCLVPTPDELIEKELRKYLYMFGGEADNPHYIEIEEQMYWNHKYGVLEIPEEERVKSFHFERDDKYIQDLQNRVELARDVYDNLTFGTASKMLEKAA